MSESWRVAELLEDIAKNADPSSVLSKRLFGILENARTSNIGFGINTNPQAQTVTATYLIPVDVAMRGVEGTPEEVIQWLQTGLGPDQKCTLVNQQDKPCFSIQCIYRDGYILDDVEAVLKKFEERIERRSAERG